MTVPTILYAGKADQRDEYETFLRAAMQEQGLEARLVMEVAAVAPEEVDYLVFNANGPVKTFEGFTGLRAILNLWAGVETVLDLPLPAGVPLCRMIEPGLTLGMIDYVVGHTTRYHIELDQYVGTEPIADWEASFPPLAQDRVVGILGLGALGLACGEKLAGLGFQVLGWSRSPKEAPGIACHSGAAGLDVVLSRSEILVLLLPQTPATERLLNASRLALMPRGSRLINAGRGPLIDHEALLAALDRGHIAHATMDVFDVEPLPKEHPYWSHPRVTVTPHIASVTRPKTASAAIVANIRRDLAGEALIGVVDPERGY